MMYNYIMNTLEVRVSSNVAAEETNASCTILVPLYRSSYLSYQEIEDLREPICQEQDTEADWDRLLSRRGRSRSSENKSGKLRLVDK